MAKTVIPEFIGRVRGAERNVRYIPTNEGRELMEAGKAISAAGKTALKGLGVIAELADERYRAEYSRALMEAEAEAGRRFDEEIRQKGGFAAEGAAQRAQQIYAEVGAKYRPNVAERYQEQFDVAWGKHSGGQFRVAADFEFRNVRQANMDADNAIMQSARDRAATSMNPEAQSAAWGEMTDAYNRLFRARNGGRLFDRGSLEAFDKDVNDGDNVLTVNGKPLKIADADGEGTISRERVNKIREAMEIQVKAYEKGLTDQYDLSHAKVVDELLKDDRLDEARKYIDKLKAREVPSSEAAVSKMEQAYKKHEEVRAIKTTGEKLVADAVSATNSSLYGSAEQDLKFKEALLKINDPKKRSYAGQLYLAKKQEQAARLDVDTIKFIQENLQTTDANGKKVQLPLHEQKTKIDQMAEGPLKDAVKKQYNAMVRAYNNEREASPEYVLYADQALLKVANDIPNGFYTKEDGTRVELNTNEKIGNYLRSFGFTSKYQKLALGIVKDSRNAITPQEVRQLFSKAGIEAPVGGKWEAFFMRQLEDARGGQIFKTQSDRMKWAQGVFNDMLEMEIGKDSSQWYWFDHVDDEKIKTHIRDDKDMEGRYSFSKEGIEALWKRKANAGSPRAAAIYGDKETAAIQFTGRGGEVPKGGQYYYLGGKEYK